VAGEATPDEGTTEAPTGEERPGWRARLRRGREDGAADAEAEGGSGPSRKRRILVWSLIVLAALIAFVGSFTIWVKRQMLDTDRWVETSTELLQDEDVQVALATRLSDQLAASGSIQASLEDRLPSSLDALAAPLAGVVNQAAYSVALRMLSSPDVQNLWAEVNRRAHSTLVAVLKGEDVRNIGTAGGQVVLDLSPLLQRLIDRLGLSVQPAEGAGQIVLFTSDRLATAQKLVRILDVLTVFLALVTLALLALAIYLARGFRRRTLRNAGFALIVIGVLLLVLRRLAGNAVIDSLTSDATEQAGRNTWLIASNLLQDQASLFIAYGLVAVVAAWIAGPHRWAVAFRRLLTPTFRHRPALAFAAAFLLYLLVILWGPTGESRRLIAILILGALIGLGVEALRRQTLREFPGAPPAGPTPAGAGGT
jgi:hypothetical protein